MTVTDVGLTVRLATTADLPFIVAGAKALAELEQADAALPLKADFEERLEQYFQHMLDTPSALMLIAESSIAGEPALGYLAGSLQTMPNDFTNVALYGLIQILWVNESARRGGIGQTLLTLFEATLREQGVHHVDAQYARSNVPAAEFWQRNGYQPISVTVRKFL